MVLSDHFPLIILIDASRHRMCRLDKRQDIVVAIWAPVSTTTMKHIYFVVCVQHTYHIAKRRMFREGWKHVLACQLECLSEIILKIFEEHPPLSSLILILISQCSSRLNPLSSPSKGVSVTLFHTSGMIQQDKRTLCMHWTYWISSWSQGSSHHALFLTRLD